MASLRNAYQANVDGWLALADMECFFNPDVAVKYLVWAAQELEHSRSYPIKWEV